MQTSVHGEVQDASFSSCRQDYLPSQCAPSAAASGAVDPSRSPSSPAGPSGSAACGPWPIYVPVWQPIDRLPGTDFEPFLMPQSYNKSGAPTLPSQLLFERHLRDTIQWPLGPPGMRSHVARGLYSYVAPHVMDFGQFRGNVEAFLVSQSSALLEVSVHMSALEQRVASLAAALAQAQDDVAALRQGLMRAEGDIVEARSEVFVLRASARSTAPAGAAASPGPIGAAGSSAVVPDLLLEAIRRAQRSASARRGVSVSPLWTPRGGPFSAGASQHGDA